MRADEVFHRSCWTTGVQRQSCERGSESERKCDLSSEAYNNAPSSASLAEPLGKNLLGNGRKRSSCRHVPVRHSGAAAAPCRDAGLAGRRLLVGGVRRKRRFVTYKPGNDFRHVYVRSYRNGFSQLEQYHLDDGESDGPVKGWTLPNSNAFSSDRLLRKCSGYRTNEISHSEFQVIQSCGARWHQAPRRQTAKSASCCRPRLLQSLWNRERLPLRVGLACRKHRLARCSRDSLPLLGARGN